MNELLRAGLDAAVAHAVVATRREARELAQVQTQSLARVRASLSDGIEDLERRVRDGSELGVTMVWSEPKEVSLW